MSTISASTTSTTAYKVTADTTGTLVFQTGATPTTAMTLGTDQSVTFAGTPTYSGGTANGVAYLNGSKVLTTGSALVFDGSNLGLGVTPSAWSGSYKSGVLSLPAGNNIAIESSNQFNLVYNAYLTSGGWARVNTDYSSIFQQSSGEFTWYSAASGASGSAPSFSSKMKLDASGNLLVGTTSNSPSTTAGVYIYGASTVAGYLLNNSTSSAGISLALFYSSYSTANQTKFEVTSEGNVKSRTNSYAGFSDERLKQNITPASSQWNDIKSYDVVKFQMKSEQFSDDENPWMLGVIAQQVEKISPGLVDEDAKDGMKTVKYSILYMKAVKALQENMIRTEALEVAIQEQQALITQLQADVAALKGASA